MTETMPAITTLDALREAEASCTRCPLFKDATQVVPGEGPAPARLMLVVAFAIGISGSRANGCPPQQLLRAPE
ncbi:MAG: hypothetical protein WAL40_17670 [Rhodoplanes sp.]